MTPTSHGNSDSKERFTTRVDAYREFRPRYPNAVLQLLEEQCGLTPASVIADIGAGTGLLAEIFLSNGNSVLAVEPNLAMRTACEDLHSRYPKLKCIAGSGEATELPDNCADFVTVGQALHWFRLSPARAEFARILRPDGWCVVVYNNRRVGGDAFHDGYERILCEFGIDYEQVRNRYVDENGLAEFFAPAKMHQAHLPNAQVFGLEEMAGRILSSSYMPQQDHPRYPAMARAIESLFTQCQKDGYVRLEYDCAVSYGKLK
ncbi:MAG: class I SAM-dependent methyltransferase [Acidobacteriaceae bacterium]